MTTNSESEPLVEIKSPWTAPLIISSTMVVLGCSFQFGYQTGALANGKKVLMYRFHKDESSTEISVMVAGMAIGGIFGGLCAGYVADIIGRKKWILLNNIPLIIGTVLMVVAHDEYSFIVGRIIAGFSCGVSTGIGPMYLSEITPVSIKGAIGVLHQLMITIGIFVAFLLSLDNVLLHNYDHNSELWRVYFGVPLIFSAIQMCILPLCPESPNWLYFNKEREDLARLALTKLRKDPQIADSEINAMIEERVHSNERVMVTYKQLFTTRSLLLALVIGIGLQGAQQFSGIVAILNYAPEIFKNAGVKKAEVVTALTGGVNVLMTFVSVPLIDRLGRRSLMIIGQAFMVVSYIGLSIAQTYNHCDDGSDCKLSWNAILSIITVFVFIIFFAIGPGSIPWLIIGEIFTSEARGKASGICVGANWLGQLLITLFYAKLQDALGKNLFFLFTGLVAFFLLFTILVVPETKQKPVDVISREIQEQANKCPPFVF